MKLLKQILWIIILFIIQTVFAGAVNILGFAPDLLLAFAVIFVVCEKDWTSTLYISLACGILAGSCAGREFSVVVLVFGACGALSQLPLGRIKFIPGFIRAFFAAVFAAFIMGAAEFFIASGTISAAGVLGSVLPFTAYTAAAVCILYPLVRHSLFRRSAKKLVV